MLQAIRAVIFDFNGTLFNDTSFHNTAWKEFALKYGKTLTPDELDKNIHGFTNREILKYLFQRPLAEKELKNLYEEKENLYRSVCCGHPEKCILTKGTEDFIGFLCEINIPRTIATASYLPNVEMYFKIFNLERWFQLNQVIYDSGEFRGKPHPDMFLAASVKLGIPIADCMVIEDSKGGIQAAKNAGAGTIIAADFEENRSKFSQFTYIDRVISDFRQLKSYFE